MFSLGPSLRGKNYSIDMGPVWYSGSGLPAGLQVQAINSGPGNTLIAVGTNTSGLATTLAAKTVDGITWTSVTMPSSSEWKRVAYGNNTWVVLCGNSATANSYATSIDDGSTWTARTMPTSGYWYCLGFGNGRFLATTYGGSNVYWSTDGISWTSASLGTSGNWRSIAYGNGVWLLVSDSTAQVLRSTDNGLTWAAGGNATPAYNVALLGDLFYICHSTTTSYYTSTDGVSWTARAFPNTATFRNRPVYNGNFFGVTDGATDKPLISLNGLSWNLATNALPSSGAWATWASPGVWVAIKGSSSAYAIL